MIEYYPILAITLASLFKQISISKHAIYRVVTYSVVTLCVYLNFDMIYYYDGCFYGGNWDLEAYLKLLEN
jgi:hypothetical protein